MTARAGAGRPLVDPSLRVHLARRTHAHKPVRLTRELPAPLDCTKGKINRQSYALSIGRSVMARYNLCVQAYRS